jgi:hypothetical protein
LVVGYTVFEDHETKLGGEIHQWEGHWCISIR